MALTEEQKATMRANLDKLTPDELKDLNVALNDKLDDEQREARAERQKALYAFLHPNKSGQEEEKPTKEEGSDEPDPYLEKLKLKFKNR